MRLKLDVLWHEFNKQWYLIPTVCFCWFGKKSCFPYPSWTLDIIWLKLYITISHIKNDYGRKRIL